MGTAVLAARMASAQGTETGPTVYVPRSASITPLGGHSCSHVAEQLPQEVAKQLAIRSIDVVRDPAAPYHVEIELVAAFENGRRDDDARMITRSSKGVFRDVRTSVSTVDDCRSFAAVAAVEFVDDLLSADVWRALLKAVREPPATKPVSPGAASPQPAVAQGASAPPGDSAPAVHKAVAPSASDNEARPPSTLAAQVQTIFQDKCLHCHGGQNGQAEKDVYILDHPRLLKTRVVRPKDLESPLWSVIKSGEMPEDDELSDGDKDTIRRWIEAGAPDWAPQRKGLAREFLEDDVVVAAIQQDLVEARERDRKWMRYFSIAHLYNAGLPDGALESYRVGLSLLLNSLSWRRKVSRPTPLGPADVLLRIDLRDYNWKDGTWAKILEHDSSSLRRTSAMIQEVEALSGSPVPYLRADWFVAQASVPPLYHTILDLPMSERALEERLQVDVKAHLERKRDVFRAGLRKSGVSRHNRVVERHVSAFGAYWKSFDFSSSAGRKNIFGNPVEVHPDGGEMVFNLPNGMQAYFIVDAKGRRIDRAPVSIVFDRDNADGPEVVNGRSCMRCHFNAVRQLSDDVRPMLDQMTTDRAWIEEARELYRGQGVLNAALEEDRARYRRAVEAAGGTVAESKAREPIYRLARRFEADLGVAQAAAEVGLTAAQLRLAIAGSPKLQEKGVAQLLVSGASIKRDAWERAHSVVLLASMSCDYVVSFEQKARSTRAGFRGFREPAQVPTVGSCMITRAAGYERAHPEQAKATYEAIIADHATDTCGAETEVACGSLAKMQLAALSCRLSSSDPRGGATQAELRKKLTTALEARDGGKLTQLAACTVYVGTLGSDDGSDETAADAVAYLLQLVAKGQWSLQPVADGLRLVGESDKYELSFRRQGKRWVWTGLGLDLLSPD